MKRTKDEVQREARAFIDQNGGSGIVEMATGTGKSKIPIDIAKAECNSDYKILLVVPTQKLRDVNWRNEFDKWEAIEIWDQCVQRECYASLHKVKGHFDLIIMDEVHNITELNSVFFDQCTFKRIIGLTATMPKKGIKMDILEAQNFKVVYTVSVDEAVQWGLISPYKITIIKTTLNRIIKNVAAGNKQNPFFQSEQDAYNYLSKTIDELQYVKVLDPLTGNTSLERRDLTSSDKKKLEMLIFKRMRLIQNLSSKLAAAVYVRDHMLAKGTRTLIFAGSIAHAQYICHNSFHSKSPKNDTSFDDFSAKRISMLSCVNSLNEGHNIPDVDNALVIQLNSNDLHLIQRIGRIVRYRDGHLAQIYVLVAKNTVDEDWAKKAMKEFDHSNISVIDFSEFHLQNEN